MENTDNNVIYDGISDQDKRFIRTFQQNLSVSESHRQSYDDLRKKWKSIYAGDPYGNEREGKSAIIIRHAKRSVDAISAGLLSAISQSSNLCQLSPQTLDDVDYASKMTKAIHYYYRKKFPHTIFENDLIRTGVIEGEAVIRVGWHRKVIVKKVRVDKLPYQMADSEQYKQQIQQEGFRIAKQTPLEDGVVAVHIVQDVVLSNRPDARVVLNSNFYQDSTTLRINDARFVIEKYETTASDLRMNSTDRNGSYLNVEKIIKTYPNGDRDDKVDEDTVRTTTTPNITDNLPDTPNVKYVVYEYWGYYDYDGDGIAEPMHAIFHSSGIPLLIEDNPFPSGWIPYFVWHYKIEPGEQHGVGESDNLEEMQHPTIYIYVCYWKLGNFQSEICFYIGSWRRNA